MAILKIESDVTVDPAYRTKCIKCGQEIVLWFNGGELDSHVCCGLIYSIESPRIDFIVRDNE